MRGIAGFIGSPDRKAAVVAVQNMLVYQVIIRKLTTSSAMRPVSEP